jgi:hypothetical protein
VFCRYCTDSALSPDGRTHRPCCQDSRAVRRCFCAGGRLEDGPLAPASYRIVMRARSESSASRWALLDVRSCACAWPSVASGWGMTAAARACLSYYRNFTPRARTIRHQTGQLRRNNVNCPRSRRELGEVSLRARRTGRSVLHGRAIAMAARV